ncbi:uncharacterized protein LAJ45_08154 [Morchella importuna]|uniref:Uncharacterized protein n=1 Tax=Morchella conica CCBAS932 TaxID=1392247 RepID=A0A3N4KXF3_9PEZI|nr:uncharacterized protein LAJ45_08154 [Morchella importuna]KAH8147690.1 hypothetical protein LAJ45_08154 [Morchella importuna]RPB10455.1 hypothetical protein P167DRAFT_576340 [Morchella conica CCBAS932]
MILKRLRGFTIAVSVLALVSNGLSACLFHKLSSDTTYRSSDSLALYTYFAAFISGLGVYGSIKQHAYTLSIFANFFILDTVVSVFSRFVLLFIFSTFRDHLCDAESPSSGLLSLTLPHGTFHTTTFNHISDIVEAAGVDGVGLGPSVPKSEAWGCSEMMQISIMVGWIGLFTSTLVQMFFAIMVRHYAMSLWKTEDGYIPLNNADLEEGVVNDEFGRAGKASHQLEKIY